MTRNSMHLLSPGEPLPSVESADDAGLVCIGGGLETARLVAAYRTGIFPWPLFGKAAPLLWFSPDPRFVLFPAELHCSRSLRRTLNRGRFTVTANLRFESVVKACSQVARPDQDGSWITPALLEAYLRLHRIGLAHSVEVFEGTVSQDAARNGNARLVGGLYGVAIGGVFFGESMFARVSDASKVAFVLLVGALHSAGFGLIDCQQQTQHLERFGARAVPRREFTALLGALVDAPISSNWQDVLMKSTPAV